MINAVSIAYVRSEVVSLLTVIGIGAHNVVEVVVERVDVGLQRG
jgi:hypothetical protein